MRDHTRVRARFALGFLPGKPSNLLLLFLLLLLTCVVFSSMNKKECHVRMTLFAILTRPASGGPCQGGRRAERASLPLSLSAGCPSGQDPPEADEKDASGGPCQGGRRAERASSSHFSSFTLMPSLRLSMVFMSSTFEYDPSSKVTRNLPLESFIFLAVPG